MPPEDGASFERTLELGKEIAKNLPGDDVLGRWMSHHISDLITRAETTPGPDGDEIRSETARTILELWAHRADLPVRNRPMATFKPVFTALDRLSEPQEPWAFYGTFEKGNEPSHADMIGALLLKLALELEDTAREVVQQIVIFAADEATDTEAKWLQLSAHLGEDDQRRARRSIRQLQRSLTQEYERLATDQDPVSDVADDRAELVATMRRAEGTLERIRKTLEAHLSRTDDSTPKDLEDQL